MRKKILNLILIILSFLSFLPAFAKAPAKQLNLAAVKQVVKSKLLEVQKCYTDLIIEGMAKAGTVIVAWDIDDKGVVQNLTIKENTSGDQALAGCVTEKVQNWVFPPAEPEMTFAATYSFKFGN